MYPGPLAANPSRNSRCLRARAPMMASGYKYRMALIEAGVCVLRYDNEAGKGDQGRGHSVSAQGLMSVGPQPSKPLMSRVTMLALLARAMAAIMRSCGAVGRPARLRVAKMPA